MKRKQEKKTKDDVSEEKRTKKIRMVPDGLVYVPNFLTDEESLKLIKFIDKQDWSKDLSRRTQHYGYKYDYSSSDTKEKAQKIPEEFAETIEKLKEYFPNGIDQIIVNEYLVDQGISKHIDKTDIFEDTIASISLLCPTEMKFYECEKIEQDQLDSKKKISRKETGESHSEILEVNSLVVLSKDARYHWKHEIQKKKTFYMKSRKYKKKDDYRRVSLTFRKMKKAF